jgi:DNA-binding beta-propeller fold protein YncE
MKFKRIVEITYLLLAFLVPMVSANTKSVDDGSYWYNTQGEVVTVPDSYYLKQVIPIPGAKDELNIDYSDFCVDDKKNVYILDKASGRIAILNSQFVISRIITQFPNSKGEVLMLSKPQGISFTPNGNLLVADTGNHRILKLDINGNVMAVFDAPKKVDALEKGQEYLPIKMVGDASDRLYVVAQGINMGFLELDGKGEFISYIGAPPVSVDAFTLFWRRFSTAEQLNRMLEFVPTEYNNIAIDNQGFLYGTISALAKQDLLQTIQARDKSGYTSPIRKLNPNGQDILRRQGNFPPVGDVDKDSLSKIIDVAVTDTDRYALLDSSEGRIFSYDSDGNLLSVFASIGSQKGQFVQPVAISYINDQLVVLDAKLGQLIIFSPTEYGKIINTAVEQSRNGDYDASNKEWGKLLQMNPHFNQAYIGVGKSKYMSGHFNEAMKYFKYADDKDHYDEAFQAYRKQLLGNGFGNVFLVIAILIVAAFFYKLIGRIVRYVKGGE